MLSGVYQGHTVISVELTDAEWAEIRNAARHGDEKQLTSPFTGDAMMCVQNRRGLRFFRMHPGGHDGLTEPETEHHLRLKTGVWKTARQLGFEAQPEAPGPNREWVADVLIQRPGSRPLAVEIQWSYQNVDDFEYRTERYRQNGIDCVWLYAIADYRKLEVDGWAAEKDEDDEDDGNPTPEPLSSWCGTDISNGIRMFPVNRMYEMIRYDGRWHTVEQFTRDLLTGRIKPDPQRNNIVGTGSPAYRDVIHPKGYPPTTFHRLIDGIKGITANTRSDVADYRMGMIGWQHPDIRPTPADYERIRAAAIKLASEHEELRNMPDWRSDLAAVECAGFRNSW